MNPYLNPRQGLHQNQGAAMQVKKGLIPVEKANNEVFRESAGRQANEAAIAMQNLATTYRNSNTGVSKMYPSARCNTSVYPAIRIPVGAPLHLVGGQ
jgi:hypothetical protein